MFRLFIAALFALSILFTAARSADSAESLLDLLSLDDDSAEEVAIEGEGEGEPIEDLSAKERFVMGIEFASKGKLDEASKEIELALLLEPQNPVLTDVQRVLTDVYEQSITKEIAVYLFKGMNFGRKRLYVKEAAYYDKALKHAPLYAPLFLYRGRSLQMSGNPNEAIEDYTRAIDLEPSFAYAYYTRGLAYKKAELFELALEDYTRAIKLEEGFAMAYNNRGFLYLVNLGDIESGCADWQRACELGLCKNIEMARTNADCE